MLYKNREKFNFLSIKIGMLFSKLPLTPNQWTLLSLVPAILVFYFLSLGQFFFAGLLFAIAGFLDFVDGSVARVTGRATKFGAYLDTVVDRFVEFFAVAGVFFLPLPGFFVPANFWLFLYLFGSMMTTYVKAAAKEKDLVQQEIKGGLFERAERLMLLFLGILAAPFGLIYLTAVIVVLAIVSNLSALQRIFVAKEKG